MINSKLIIIGQIIRREGNKVYVSSGDSIDVYNTDYYRIVPSEGR
ncbi:hypothetical protein [Paenibacillus cellulosilyticus]|nr:hypothetical protein [Paenibacillus cellulosilyticus]